MAVTPAARAAPPCEYEERIVELSDSIVLLGEDVGGALLNAEDRTDAELARQFTRLGRRTRRNERRVDALDPPEALQTPHADFRAAIPPVRRDLFGIARAAKNHNANAARTWTLRLINHSPRLRKARQVLVRRVHARLRDRRCE
jgi:hypothetical protein